MNVGKGIIRNRRFSVAGAALLLAGAISIGGLQVEAGPVPDGKVTVEIIHTNDIHGRSGYEEGSVFGFDKLATYIDQQNPDLVIDAGDLYHGQAFATMEQGGSIAELVKEVGYDFLTPGNHDWNYGKDRLKELGDLSDLTILAGNITENGTDFFGNDGTYIAMIEEEDGDSVQVGILGVFDQDVKKDTAPSNVNILVREYRCSGGTDTANPAAGNRCTGTGIPHLIDCYLRVYSLKAGSNPYTSRIDL